MRPPPWFVVVVCLMLGVTGLATALHWRAQWEFLPEAWLALVLLVLLGRWSTQWLVRYKSAKAKKAGRSAKRLIAQAGDVTITPGFVVFNPPSEMQQGKQERVEVGVTRAAVLKEVLAASFRGHGGLQFEEIETSSVMGVALKGHAFDITSYSAPEQIVMPQAKWEFDVLPIRAGRHTLTVNIRLQIALPGHPEFGIRDRSVPVLQRTVRIRVDLGYNARRFAVGNWQWLIATVIGLAGAITAWVELVH